MVIWLKKEVHPIKPDKSKKKAAKKSTKGTTWGIMPLSEDKIQPGVLLAGSMKDAAEFSGTISPYEYSIRLRNITVLNNKKLFGSSKVIVNCIVLNGLPDMKEKRPFWIWEKPFPNVDDGTRLSIDDRYGVQVFSGRPFGFLNMSILLFRDIEASRMFAKILGEKLDAQNVGKVAGDLIPIFSGLDPTASIVAEAAKLIEKAFDSAMQYCEKQKNPVIGVYYVTLPEDVDYGLGLNPPDYPKSMIDCQKTMQVAYEVKKV